MIIQEHENCLTKKKNYTIIIERDDDLEPLEISECFQKTIPQVSCNSYLFKDC